MKLRPPLHTHRQPRYYRAQRGVALITVLMVFAIATIVATKVIVAKNIDTQRVTGVVNRTQAYHYALAAEQLAILALMKDEEEDAKNTTGDTLDEGWAARAIPYEIDPFSEVVIRIIDLNRYYNLNNLIQENGKVNAQEMKRFAQLLEALDLNDELADNLADWLDSDSQESGYQSESDSYENFTPGYLAGNQRFTDVSELRLVNGFTAEVIAALDPHITVLHDWGVLALNVNTATPYALATLQRDLTGSASGYEGVTLNGARNIESDRSYDTVQEFLNAKVVTNLVGSTAPNPGENVGRYTSRLAHYGVDSEYYELNIRASYGGHVSYLSSVVKRTGQGQSASFEVIQRTEKDNSQRFLR